MGKQRDLARALQDLRDAKQQMSKLEDRAPTIAGVEGIKWIQENFQKESYDGKKWKPRSDRTNAAYDRRSGVKGSVFNSGNPILRQTGNLFDAIRKKITGTKVFLGFDTGKVPYGVVHNEGGVIEKTTRKVTLFFRGGRFAAKQKGTRRKKKDATIYAHGYKMPKRQFMPAPGEPENPRLRERIVRKILFERDRILSKFKR